MFVQTRTVYIVGGSAGNPYLIHKSLDDINCLQLFFGKKLNPESDVYYNKFLSNLPPETVFSISVYFNKHSEIKNKYFISIPFMSSHISLPLKVGEIIWIYPHSPAMDIISQNEMRINGYHLSRVHSMLGTEDVTFCYADRDYTIFDPYNLDITNVQFSQLKSKQKLDFGSQILDYSRSVLEPSTKRFSDETSFINNTYFNSKINANKFRANPRIQKDLSDTILQGSHNTLISLSSNQLRYFSTGSTVKSGEIKISAGINQNIFKKLEPSNLKISVIDEKNNFVSQDTVLRIFQYENKKVLQIYNGLHFETIKTPKQLVDINVSLPDFKNKQFATDLTRKYSDDSSSLKISENSTDFVDLNIDNEIFLFDTQNNSIEVLKPKNIVKKESNDEEDDNKKNKFKIKKLVEEKSSHARETLIPLEDNSSIVGVADNISLALHKDSPGHLNLIQPNSLDEKTSQIKLTNHGNILLDGNKILIGDYNRLTDKKPGGEALVFLGHSEDSQSLVLGEQLKEFMLELLDVQRESMKDIKELFEKSKETKKEIQENIKKQIDAASEDAISEYNKVIHDILLIATSSLSISPPGTPVTTDVLLGILKPLEIAFSEFGNQNKFIDAFNRQTATLKKDNDTLIENFETGIKNKLLKRNEKLSQRLEAIEKNINEILSKFSKTS